MSRLLPRLALDPRLVTILLALVATLLPVALVAAATRPLGFTLGQTTLAEVERSVPPDRIEQRAISAVTEGAWLGIDPAAFDFDGLEKVVLVFDGEQHLAGVVLTIAKRRFVDVLSDLRAKYSADSENIDNFMRNGEARFRSGDGWIYFNAPHLSFSLSLIYATDEMQRENRRRNEENEAKKRQQERGKL